MQDAGIVRNRAKIEATVALARVYLDLTAEKGGASPAACGASMNGRAIQNARRSTAELPANTRLRAPSPRTSPAGPGLIWSGPTIIYAFMQATGMVTDHLVDCCRHEACRALAREFRA